MLLSTLENQLPEIESIDYRSKNKTLFDIKNSTCFVLDDDPTGNQTVYGITLLSSWDIDIIESMLLSDEKICFILTNSRSLSEQEAFNTFSEVMNNIIMASKNTGINYSVISRSDSTLRGHFPLETDVIQKKQKSTENILFLLPMMFEGGRMTYRDTHYICNQDKLTPVSESNFAKDHTFGYNHSDLKVWIEEKTKGTTSATKVVSFSLEDIRTKTPKALASTIEQIPANSTCIANAITYADLDKFCNALLLTESNGKSIIYRTSSSFLPSYIGLPPTELLTKEAIIDSTQKTGGLVIIGSYVSKTSNQLNYYKKHRPLDIFIEIKVEHILQKDSENYIQTLVNEITSQILQNHNVVVYTSRSIKLGNSIEENITIGKRISNALIEIVTSLKITPSFLVAKGGITSHDIATKGLKMTAGKVLGQILPGIPVWEINANKKLYKLRYIVFPGNVGDKTTLFQLIKKLT